MSVIYSWVKSIIIFLLLATIINNLLGKSQYKKYISLITGMILVLLVISPLLKLFQIDDIFDYFYSFHTLSIEAKDMKEELRDVEDGQMISIMKEYKQKIKDQVSDLLKNENLYLVDITITINEEEDSDKFGNLDSMDITASYIRQDVESNKVDKISIDDIEIGDTKDSEAGDERNNLSPDEINAKNLLSDFYNVDPDNINISIQEQ